MAILLTGGNGLLGANLVRELNRRGDKPRLLLRERSNRRGLTGASFTEARGDILDPSSLDEAMRGVDRVFHLAGAVWIDPFSRETVHRLNVDGAMNVARAARKAGVKRFVHVSSIAAVGHGPLSAPATEETAFNFTGDLPYHQSKREGEARVLDLFAPGFDVVVANPTFVVGAYDARPSSGELLLAVARGWVAAFPSGGNNFVNATDIATGLVLLMERGRARDRYILGGEDLTYRRFLTQCAEEAGARPPMIPIPDALLTRAGEIGDHLGRLAPRLFRNLNSALLSPLQLPAYASSQKAQRELGYSPKAVRAGIREAYRWFQEEGYLRRDRPLSPSGVIASG